MTMRIDHLINGQPVAGSAYFETINPATQEVLAEVAAGGDRNGPPRRRPSAPA
jgi:5-carboxymethyl-2-hydroxymuconic-semialdehyde dehydrogenase